MSCCCLDCQSYAETSARWRANHGFALIPPSIEVVRPAADKKPDPSRGEPDNRPKCTWNPRDKDGVRQGDCGSADGVRTIERDYGWQGRAKERICEKHVKQAWKKFNNPEMLPKEAEKK